VEGVVFLRMHKADDNQTRIEKEELLYSEV